MKYVRVLIILLILWTPLGACALNTVPRDSIVADFDTLVSIIVRTHPDPYTNHGGRVHFYRHAEELRNTIALDSNPTIEKLYEKASLFMAQLQDGHSFINMPAKLHDSPDSDSLLLVKFIYAADNLIVNAIAPKDRSILGSRLVGINGIAIEKIAERIANVQPCENKAGRYGFFNDYFRSVRTYRRLVGDDNACITMNIITPSGDSIDYRPHTIHYSDLNKVDKTRTPTSDKFPKRNMEWKVVKNTMLFKLTTVNARENFEFMYQNGWDYFSQLRNYYAMTRTEMPTDTLAAINSLPSISETFLTMLNNMKTQQIKKLIIDLRGNGGGWTPIIIPTLYMMFGDDYINADLSTRFYCRVSRLYLDKLNTTVDQFNKSNGLDLKIGDYIFPDESPDYRSLEQKRDFFIGSSFCSDSVRDILRAANGRPIYRPETIYVVTDAGTFSAAFHYAFYLNKMGAILAGETSAQAPNCYMEATPFTLPYSHLTGSVSNSLQEFLTADDTRAREFTPDIRLSYDDYWSHSFDNNSILIHLLSIGNQ